MRPRRALRADAHGAGIPRNSARGPAAQRAVGVFSGMRACASCGWTAHGRVPAQLPGVGQQRMRPVEQPQLAALERLEVLDEHGIGHFETAIPRREAIRQSFGTRPERELFGYQQAALEILEATTDEA